MTRYVCLAISVVFLITCWVFIDSTMAAGGDARPGPVSSRSGHDEPGSLEIARLEKALAAEEKELALLAGRLEELQAEEKNRLSILGQGQKELMSIETVVRLAARETGELIQGSLNAPAYGQGLDFLEKLNDPERFPGLAEIEGLIDFLFFEIKASGKIETREGAFIDRSGRENKGAILCAGGISAFYRAGEEIGFLSPLADGRRLLALPVDPDKTMTGDIRQFFEGQGQSLPLDLSGGAVFGHMGSRPGWGERLAAGGVLVWPILLVAGVALILTLERLLVLGRLKGNSQAVFDQVKDLASREEWEACDRLCRDKRTPACRVIRAGLNCRGRSPEIVENAVQEAMLGQLPKLERFLPTLSVLAAIAPLLGLLGTVTGMIETFRIITVFGTSDPKLMAGGISEALITTQLGLAVAMPIMLVHHFLERRVDRILDDMEERGLALSEVVSG